MKYFMAVTPDKYELPLYVAESVRELAIVFKTSENAISSSIGHGLNGKKQGHKFIRVDIDKVDE